MKLHSLFPIKPKSDAFLEDILMANTSKLITVYNPYRRHLV